MLPSYLLLVLDYGRRTSLCKGCRDDGNRVDARKHQRDEPEPCNELLLPNEYGSGDRVPLDEIVEGAVRNNQGHQQYR